MNLTSTKPAILWSLMLCLGLLVLPFSRASAQLGIWTSAQELATLPMAGEAWQDVFEAGSKSIARPRLSNQNDRTNVLALAAAIVYARTGEVDYKERVSETCEKLAAGGNPGGRTLAWARGLGAYALAADLVGYRTPEFEQWLRAMADEFLANDKRTLRGMFQERPNNWGAHAFGSLCAVYRYLGDFEALRQVRDYWVQSLTGPNPGLDYGEDSTWHAVPTDPRWINPKGMYRDTLNIGGIVPDDMRRGGSFQTPPTYTSYAWEGLQGLLMAARILERANMPVWAEGDSALYRAASALQERFAAKFGERWQASGDDSWQLPFYDQAYGTNWVRDQRGLWKNGKSSGWGYVTLAGEQPPKFRVNVTTIDSGAVIISPPGGLYYQGAAVTLTAVPHPFSNFETWSGDTTSQERTIAIIVDGDKHLTAKFGLPTDPEYKLLINKKGRGAIEISPALELFAAGMEVHLNAKPDEGFRFKRWEGDIVTYEPAFSFIINSDTELRAVFKPLDEAAVVDKEIDALALEAIPGSYQLFQNYPNPFNPETEIRFLTTEDARVELRIYNVLGQEIRTLVSGHLPAGEHKITWNGQDKQGQPAATGIYFYSLKAGAFSDLKKMNLLR